MCEPTECPFIWQQIRLRQLSLCQVSVRIAHYSHISAGCCRADTQPSKIKMLRQAYNNSRLNAIKCNREICMPYKTCTDLYFGILLLLLLLLVLLLLLFLLLLVSLLLIIIIMLQHLWLKLEHCFLLLNPDKCILIHLGSENYLKMSN